MYIYQSGMIGEAIHAKIENMKSSVKSGDKTANTQSFSDLLKSYMVQTTTETKPVGVSNVDTGEKTVPNGRTLLYALANADSDTTASAVVGALGLPISDNSIKTSADAVSAAAQLLTSADGADTDKLLPLVSDFVDKYNALLGGLNTQTTASGIMYSRLFRTAANTASDALAKAGITVNADGTLTLDASKLESADFEGFLSSVRTAADAAATYASSITGSRTSSLLDFLGNDDDTSTASYYTGLINSMM